MIRIDASVGQGGGQILRTALAMSVVTGKSFRIRRVRAGRKKPGLPREHLTAVKAAREIGGARVGGAEIGSLEVEFAPGTPGPGDYSFPRAEAGSAWPSNRRAC